MKRLGLVLIFILGLGIIGAGLKIGWLGWFATTNSVFVVRALFVALVAVIIALVTVGILSKDNGRWTAFLFVAILLIGSLVFDPTTVGFIGVPVGLLLLVLSGGKLIALRSGKH
jgi:hypothetical protein